MSYSIFNPTGVQNFKGTQTSLTSTPNAGYSGSFPPTTSINLTFLSASRVTGSFIIGTYLYLNVASGSYLNGTFQTSSMLRGFLASSPVVTLGYDDPNTLITTSVCGRNVIDGGIYGGIVASPIFQLDATFVYTSSIVGQFATSGSITGSCYSSSVGTSSYTGSIITELYAYNCPSLTGIDLRDNPFVTKLDVKGCENFRSLTLNRGPTGLLTNITLSRNVALDTVNLLYMVSDDSVDSIVNAVLANENSKIPELALPGTFYNNNGFDFTSSINGTPEGAAAWLELSAGPFYWETYTPPPIHPTVQNWKGQVQLNGGGTVSDNTLTALTNFFWFLDHQPTLRNKLKVINWFVPDNLIACCTPFVLTASLPYSWSNSGFIAADLNINGLLGDGDGGNAGQRGFNTKRLNTGINPNTIFTTASAGMTVYFVSGSGNQFISSSGRTVGCSIGNADVGWHYTSIWPRHPEAPNELLGYLGSDGNPGGNIRVPYTSNNGSGYFSVNFLTGSSTSMAFYNANNSIGHTTLGSNNLPMNGPMANIPLHVFAFYRYGDAQFYTHFNNRIGFVALHAGLTVSESIYLHDKVQWVYQYGLGRTVA